MRLLAICILTLLAAAASAKDTLVIGVAQFPASLHPYISSQTVQFYTIGFALRPITAFDSDGKPACLLCTEMPTLQNGLARLEERPGGGQGLAVTIKLKPDLAWGDGVPVTASDLRFTWEVGRDPSNGFNSLYPWARADGVDVVDAHTAVLHLDRTLTSYQMWDYLLPEHIEGPVLHAAATPLDYINGTLFNAAPTTPGLWNGPYLVSGYHAGSSIELSANPHWAGPKPALNQIVIRLIDNTAALVANLLSGDVDMSPAGIGITTDQAVALERAHPGQFAVHYTAGLLYERIITRQENPITADLRVREALLLAIDRSTLIQRLFGGHAKLAVSWLNATEPLFTDDVPHYGFDPKRAAALLRDAGWTPGADGICRNAAGDRLSLQFTTTAGNRVRELSQQVMQSQWRAVCIEAIIHNEPSRSFFGETLRRGSFPGLAEFANNTRIGLVPTQFYATSAIGTATNNYSGQNRSGLSDPAFDALMAQAETELDPAKQATLWTAMQRRYVEELAELPLYFREDPDIVPIWLKGYVATGQEDYASEWAEMWRP